MSLQVPDQENWFNGGETTELGEMSIKPTPTPDKGCCGGKEKLIKNVFIGLLIYVVYRLVKGKRKFKLW